MFISSWVFRHGKFSRRTKRLVTEIRLWVKRESNFKNVLDKLREIKNPIMSKSYDFPYDQPNFNEVHIIMKNNQRLVPQKLEKLWMRVVADEYESVGTDGEGSCMQSWVLFISEVCRLEEQARRYLERKHPEVLAGNIEIRQNG